MITAEEKQSSEWLYNPQEIVEILDKESLPGIYNAIFYTVPGKHVTKTQSSQLSTKIWFMACDWGALLKKKKKKCKASTYRSRSRTGFHINSWTNKVAL